jgi:hypothetical protein
MLREMVGEGKKAPILLIRTKKPRARLRGLSYRIDPVALLFFGGYRFLD